MIQWELTHDRILLQNPLPTAVSILKSQKERAKKSKNYQRICLVSVTVSKLYAANCAFQGSLWILQN